VGSDLSAVSSTKDQALEADAAPPVRETTALRLKKIELSHQAAEKNADQESQRRIAVLAVSLAFGASAGVGGLAGQVPPAAAVVGLVVAMFLGLLQFRALRVVSQRMDHTTAHALAAIDKLIAEGGESDVDAQADAEGA
jgi:hypothetical protein